MYGIINKGIRDMVINNHSPSVWEEIKVQAGCNTVFFSNMCPYNDTITYDLVDAAAKVLRKTTEEIFVAFGEYWVIHTVHEGYGPILKLAGNSFYEILTNLDDLHIRVGHTFVNQHPPSFTCKKIDDHTLRLVYRSIREGLSPLVFGLLRGLAKSFNRKVEIEHLIKREAQGYDEFLVKHFPLETTEQHDTQINHNSITQSNKTVDGKVKCPFSQS